MTWQNVLKNYIGRSQPNMRNERNARNAMQQITEFERQEAMTQQARTRPQCKGSAQKVPTVLK
jgi:hypothetical protein